MDYYQGAVTEYLRADYSRYVSTEHLIQLDEGINQACKPIGFAVSPLSIKFSRTPGAPITPRQVFVDLANAGSRRSLSS